MIFKKKVSSTIQVSIDSDSEEEPLIQKDKHIKSAAFAKRWDTAANLALNKMEQGESATILNPLFQFTDQQTLGNLGVPTTISYTRSLDNIPASVGKDSSLASSSPQLVKVASDPEIGSSKLANSKSKWGSFTNIFKKADSSKSPLKASSSKTEIAPTSAERPTTEATVLTTVLSQIDNHWTQGHYQTDGIYREGGSTDLTKTYYAEATTKAPSKWKSIDFNATKEITSLIKLLVKDFFTTAFAKKDHKDAVTAAIKALSSAQSKVDAEVVIPILNHILDQFRPHSRSTFKLLLQHFQKVTEQTHLNQMTRENLAISILSPKFSDLFEPLELHDIIPKTQWLAVAFLIHAEHLKWD